MIIDQEIRQELKEKLCANLSAFFVLNGMRMHLSDANKPKETAEAIVNDTKEMAERIIKLFEAVYEAEIPNKSA
jgi:hypothetical protein